MGILWYVEGKRTHELFGMGKSPIELPAILSKRFPRDRFIRVLTRWWQRWDQDAAMWIRPCDEDKLPAGHDCQRAHCRTSTMESRYPTPCTLVFVHHRIGKYVFRDDVPLYGDDDPDDTIGMLAARLWDFCEVNGWEWAIHTDAGDVPRLPIVDGVYTWDRHGRFYGEPHRTWN